MSDINPEELKKELKSELIKNEILMSLDEEECFSLSDLINIGKKNWKLIFFFTLIAGIISAIYTLSLPNYYKSSATIFIFSNDRSRALNVFLNRLESNSDIDNSNASLIYSSLNSISMKEYIIKRFGIATNSAIVNNDNSSENYDLIYENTLKYFNRIVSIDYDKNNSIIKISAETKSPNISADIVNAYLERLKSFSTGPQKEKLKFIEAQLFKVKEELENSEDELRKFEEKYKIFSFDRQINIITNELATLKAKRNDIELSNSLLSSYLENSSNEAEKAEIKKQIEAETKKTIAINVKIDELNNKVSSLLQISIELSRLKRNISVKEKVYSVLNEQYEIAKISEAEEGYQYKIIDRPRIEKLKSKPYRATLCILITFTAFVLSICISIFKGFNQKSKRTIK